jgi:hypothetical protein
MLFETGPANHWIVEPWASAAPHPRGGSFALEVYRRLPNDTDFSVVKRHEVPGLNLALVGDSYAYHTARDTAERLSPVALRETGQNVVAIMEALQERDVTRRTPNGATYFDVAGVRAVSFSSGLTWILSSVAILSGLFGWFRVTRFVAPVEGTWRWLLGLVWSALGVAAVVAAMIGATWLLRAASAAYHPWYAHPDRLFLLLAAAGTLAGWAMTRLGRWLPVRARGLRHPAVVWTYALPLWIALALAGSWFAPAASYFWTLPLLAAGLLFAVLPPRNAWWVRLASLVVLAVAGTLWLRDGLELARFAVAVLGRLPIVTPAFAFAALIALTGVMVAPPFIAAIASERPLIRPAIITALCLLALAVAAPLAYLAPAYTPERPLRRDLRVFQDLDAPNALWQVGGNEAGLDLLSGAPVDWRPGRTEVATSVPRPILRSPFVFSAVAPALGEAPAAISSFTVQDVTGGVELAIAVVPRQPGLSLAFVLPEGVTPSRSSMPGVVRSRRWTAIFVAPPTEGIAFRASFTGVSAEQLRGTRVTATSARIPGGEGWQQLPPWLPQDRTVWSARATWVLAMPAAIEPVPPLR